MTTKTELAAALRTKIRNRVSGIWERLWEGEGGLDGRQVARWRRAESPIVANAHARQEKPRRSGTEWWCDEIYNARPSDLFPPAPAVASGRPQRSPAVAGGAGSIREATVRP